MATSPKTAEAAATELDELDDPDGVDPWAGFDEVDRARGCRILTPEEGRAQFDAAARRIMGISGDEFIRRWNAGEYDEIADDPAHSDIMYLALFLPHDR